MNQRFANRLRMAIRAMGINPTRFAYKAGVPQGTISKCLHGHIPTAKILVRIARASGQSVDWLLTGKEQKGRVGGYVAEKPAVYGRPEKFRKARSSEEIWVAKLLKVLRSSDQRKKQTMRELLNVLSR